MTQTRRIAARVPGAPATSQRAAAHDSPPLCVPIRSKSGPWMIFIVLLLVSIVIFALWGKLPRPSRLPHENPTGNAPTTLLLAPFFRTSLLSSIWPIRRLNKSPGTFALARPRSTRPTVYWSAKSGDLDIDGRKDWFAKTDSLKTFELGKSPVEFAAQMGFVSQEAV